MKAESLKGHLDALVLATFGDGPAHGYAVIEELRRKSEGAFDLAEGTVYPVLHRLEAGCLRAGAWSAAAGRRGRVSRVTRRARAALAERRAEWERFAHAVEAVLA